MSCGFISKLFTSQPEPRINLQARQSQWCSHLRRCTTAACTTLACILACPRLTQYCVSKGLLCAFWYLSSLSENWPNTHTLNPDVCGLNSRLTGDYFFYLVPGKLVTHWWWMDGYPLPLTSVSPPLPVCAKYLLKIPVLETRPVVG